MSAGNPLIGSGWQTQAPGQQGGSGGLFPNPINVQAPPNIPNPGGYSNSNGSGEIQNNIALQNQQAAELKNRLAPQWANLMGQYGGQAGNFFTQLMNLGSPYYRQQQAASFTQGNQQNQDAAGMARQQLQSQGYGSTPSGANAAMIGGMNMQGSQNLSEQYLQNLFNNEQMQLQGAQGLQQNAALFNPAGLLGGTSSGINYQKPTSIPQNFQTVSQGVEEDSQAVANIASVCPAKGSLYLMADGSEKPVETLKVGDVITGIDGEPERIEEIQSAVTPVLRIETDDGFIVRNSRVHAFALPAGGFVVAMYSMGETIVTAKGKGKVISVKWDGNDEVFNVITDGSHTYRADGVWALGVGEAERQVSMNRWNEIGDGLAVSHV